MVRSATVLIVAAGGGSRMGADRPKQYLPLSGMPVLRRTVRAFLRHPAISRVQLVIDPRHRPFYDEAVAGLDLPEPVAGGATRQASVYAGLEHLEALANPPRHVLIHDAARPFVTRALIDRVMGGLTKASAVIPALPLVDALKRAEGGWMTGAIEREGLWQVQTPQGFVFADILRAHRAAASAAAGYADDAAVAADEGMKVRLVEGDAANGKLTRPDDFVYAENRLRAGYVGVTGQGFDAHRLLAAPGGQGRIVLCGVAVPCEFAIEAHSDGDAGLHALVDALLGAIGGGDIGEHFPPSDPQWRDADSAMFVTHAREMLEAVGGSVLHADITLIAEQPRLLTYKPAMRMRVAELLGINAICVNIKATTTEKMGFTGRGEGIAAMAAATVMLPASRFSSGEDRAL